MSRDRIEQHPEEYRADLNPAHDAGETHGPRQHRLRRAYDIKDLHQRNADLSNDELKAIPVLEEGERLAQGAVYFDMRRPERGAFKAMGGMTAGPENWYVPKADTDYPLWNLITGVDDPDRLAELAPDSDDEEAGLRTRVEQ